MPLSITPGPLPSDGSRIQVQQTLDAFISGTRISGLGLESITDSTLVFVVSSTEAPATDARVRGLLWFQRGAGKLRQWVDDVKIGGVAAEGGLWRSISDGRQVAGYVAREAPTEGGAWIVNCESDFTGTADHKLALLDSHSIVLSMQGTGASANPTLGRSSVFDPVLIDIGADRIGHTAHRGSLTVFQESGFCDALVLGNGPVAYMPATIADWLPVHSATLFCTDASLAGPLMAEVGVLAESSASEAFRAARVFKRPQITNCFRGEYT